MYGIALRRGQSHYLGNPNNPANPGSDRKKWNNSQSNLILILATSVKLLLPIYFLNLHTGLKTKQEQINFLKLTPLGLVQ